MCYICHSRRCLPSCPCYEGESLERGRPVARCAECGRYIYFDEYVRYRGARALCRACDRLAVGFIIKQA